MILLSKDIYYLWDLESLQTIETWISVINDLDMSVT